MKRDELGWLGKMLWPLHGGSTMKIQSLFWAVVGLLFMFVARFFISVEQLEQQTFIYMVLGWIAGAAGGTLTIDRIRDIASPSAKIYAQLEVDKTRKDLGLEQSKPEAGK